MPKTLLTTLVILLLSACQQAPEPEDRLLAVRCGSLIDGLADEALGGTLVIIRNDRIESVGAVGDIPEGAEVLDLSGYTCLPGLIDTHTHIALNHGNHPE